MKKQKEYHSEPLRTFLLKECKRRGLSLRTFLLKECKRRGLSLRRLSIQSGLSPATVHGFIARRCQPRLNSLNRLADCLGVRREYLWKLAGLLKPTQYESPGDTRLNAQFNLLPEAARDLLVPIIEAVLLYFEKEATSRGTKTQEDTSHLPPGDGLDRLSQV